VNLGLSPALNFCAGVQVDARQQTEDLHDAVTWMKNHPLVDETKIAVWGICFGANVTLAAAAFEYVTSTLTPILLSLIGFCSLSSLVSFSLGPHRLTRDTTQQASRCSGLNRTPHRLNWHSG
jgi:hypothetical protein